MSKNISDALSLLLARNTSAKDIFSFIVDEVSRGLDLNNACENGDSLLFWLIRNYPDKNIVDYVAHRVNRGIRGPGGETALMAAVHFERWDLLPILLPVVSDVDYSTLENIKNPLMTAISAKNREAVEFLIDAGASIEYQDNKGYTSLMYAIENNCPDPLFSRLIDGAFLDSGTDPHVRAVTFFGLKDARGQDALIKAVICGNHQAVERLSSLESVDVNTEDKKNRSALFWAVIKGDVDSVRILLKHGANPNVTNKGGVSPLYQSISNGNWYLTELLLEFYADPNIGYPKGKSPLALAAKLNEIKLLERMLDNGGSVNVENENNDSHTLLIYAVKNRNPEMVSLLLERGAEPDLVNAHGLTALMYAVMAFKEDPVVAKPIINALLRAGADPSLEGDNGESAIKISDHLGASNLREELLRNYNYLNVKQVYGDEAQDAINKMFFSDEMGHRVYGDMGDIAIPKDYWLEKQRYETSLAKEEYLSRVKKGTVSLLLLAGGLLIPGAIAVGQLPALITEGTGAVVSGSIAVTTFLSNHMQGHGDDGRGNMLIAIQHHMNSVKKIISGSVGQAKSFLEYKYRGLLNGLSRIGEWLISLNKSGSSQDATSGPDLSAEEQSCVLGYNYNVGSSDHKDTIASHVSPKRFKKDIDDVEARGIEI